MRVLIVDDEPNIVASLDFLMRKAGYETSIARDGDEALSQAADVRPDLVLLDVMMPGRDGFSVLTELRRTQPADLKVVMLTAKGRPSEVARGTDLGADAYVTKPFSTTDLVNLVGDLLDGRAP